MNIYFINILTVRRTFGSSLKEKTNDFEVIRILYSLEKKTLIIL